jgi:hypothetical protein
MTIWSENYYNSDFSTIKEELFILGSSRLLAHTVAANPQTFVDLVVIPMIKSFTSFHPVQYMLKAICHDHTTSEDSGRGLLRFLSSYLFVSASLAMCDIFETLNSTEDRPRGGTAAGTGAETGAGAGVKTGTRGGSVGGETCGNDGGEGIEGGAEGGAGIEGGGGPSAALECCTYYLQHHRKASLGELITEIEREREESPENIPENNSVITDDFREILDRKIVWFYPLESLTDRDPAVLYRIFMSDNVQR